MKTKQKPTKKQPKDNKNKVCDKSLFEKLIKKSSQPLKSKKGK